MLIKLLHGFINMKRKNTFPSWFICVTAKLSISRPWHNISFSNFPANTGSYVKGPLIQIFEMRLYLPIPRSRGIYHYKTYKKEISFARWSLLSAQTKNQTNLIKPTFISITNIIVQTIEYILQNNNKVRWFYDSRKTSSRC